MSANSPIEWTDATWTPIQAVRKDTGKRGVACVKVSPECANCYAERLNMRNLPSHGTGLPFTVLNMEKVDIVVNEDILLWPLKWRKPRKIFVCSQTDLFGEFVSDQQIDRVFAVMALCPQHTFQVLTKRADRMLAYVTTTDANRRLALAALRQYIPYAFTNPPPKFALPNVWLGVTAGNQESADKRIPLLLQTPATVRFVSAEPLLGPLDLMWPESSNKAQMCCGGTQWDECACMGKPVNPPLLYGIDWVITGSESGPGARETNIEWVRSLKKQCVEAGVAFFYKQGAVKGRAIPTPELDGQKWMQFPGGFR